MAREDQGTEVDVSFLSRLVRGVRYVVSGTDAWFGPREPIKPMAQEAQGRQLDYQVGYNLQIRPRANESVTFEQMIALADGYDLLRLIIETRKDQLMKFEFQIKPIDQDKAQDDRCVEIQQFLRFPDRHHNWQTWLRALVEDMLVIDAAVIYPRMTRGGGVYSLDLLDGATIKRVINSDGRTPDSPAPAYQQVLHGLPAVDYSSDELIYAIRNWRTRKIYGYSPVEQIITTINIALRRQLWQLQSYTEGNIPEALASVPATWNPNQIKDFQQWFDDTLEGNTAARRHLRFIPDGMKYIPTKDSVLKDVYDEWLARIVCFAFSIPPSPFVRDMNRSTSESAKEAATEEGLIPLMKWIKDTLDLVIWKYFGCLDLEFSWEMQDALDPVEQSTIDDQSVKNGTRSINEIRSARGEDPIEGGDEVMIYTGTGPVLLRNVINPPEPVMPEPIGVGTDGKPLPKNESQPGKEPPSKTAKLAKGKKKVLY